MKSYRDHPRQDRQQLSLDRASSAATRVPQSNNPICQALASPWQLLTHSQYGIVEVWGFRKHSFFYSPLKGGKEMYSFSEDLVCFL